MTENELAAIIIDAAFEIHRSLGPGLLESAYEIILEYELRKRGLVVQRQVPLPLVWEHIQLDESYRADLLVEKSVIVELKSIERILPAHQKQVLTYLKVSGFKLGLLLNFGSHLFKEGIRRVANGIGR